MLSHPASHSRFHRTLTRHMDDSMFSSLPVGRRVVALPALLLSTLTLSAWMSGREPSPAVASCQDYVPETERLLAVGDSLVKLGAMERVTLGPKDSLGVYAAFDTTGAVVVHDARIWAVDGKDRDALREVLPSLVGKQIPISGIIMLYRGRAMPNGRHALLQWGLICAFKSR